MARRDNGRAGIVASLSGIGCPRPESNQGMRFRNPLLPGESVVGLVAHASPPSSASRPEGAAEDVDR